MTTFDEAVTFNPRDLVVNDDPFDAANARGRWGRPKVVAPDGTTAEYERPSTLAGKLDDKSGLIRWAGGMTLLGAAEDPTLITQALELDDSAADYKRQLYELGHIAKEKATANTGSDWGSLIHQITATIDRGETLDWPMPEECAAPVATYHAELARMGLTVEPEWVEFCVVNDSAKLAGTVDRLYRLSDGRLILGDIKTSKTPSHLSWATQLAIYAGATAIYDPATGERSPLPEGWSTDFAVVPWVRYAARDGEDTCGILEVPLGPATDAMLLALEVEEARKSAKSLAALVTKPYDFLPELTLADRVQRLRDEGHEAMLVGRWTAAGLGAMAGLPPEQEALAVEVVASVESAAGLAAVSITDWRGRLRKLPVDLRRGAEAELKMDTATDDWTTANAQTALTVLERAEADARARVEFVRRHLADATSTLIERYTSGIPVDALTGHQAAETVALIGAESAGVIELEAGAWQTRVSVTEWCSGTKGKAVVLETGRRLARSHNRTPPKKADDVLADPLLFALVADEIA